MMRVMEVATNTPIAQSGAEFAGAWDPIGPASSVSRWLMHFCCISLAVAGLASIASAQRTSAGRFLTKPDDWYRSAEAKAMAENILSFQTELGGWPKNIDTATQPYSGDRSELRPTFDNSATTDELRFLARMFTAMSDPRYKESFGRGLDYILKAQYPNGGWPQTYPAGAPEYTKRITFNDGGMARILFFIRDVMVNTGGYYGFVDEPHRKAATDAFNRGIDCILKCQIRVDGKLTAWCAQHDENDFSPAWARAFEPPSISGCETIGIVHILMAIEKPGPEVIAAVDAAVSWLDSVKIPGIRVEDRPQEGTPRGYERYVVKDPSAPPMWARFYEIGTNRPIFCGRDRIVKYDLSEIEIERRTGYKWLAYWPRNLLEKEYAPWRAKVSGQTEAGAN